MSDFDDNSSIYVCQWLLHWGVPFVRIDKEVQFSVSKIEVAHNNFNYVVTSSSGKVVNMQNIGSVWYRRGDLNLITSDISYIQHTVLNAEIQQYLKSENKALEYFFYHMMEEKPHLGTFRKRSVNKLIVLHEAAKLGIEIPSTSVLTSREDLQEKTSCDLITKGIYEGFRTEVESGPYTTYTEKVDKNNAPPTFFPTLFQSTIEKEADIRVFYMHGEFFSMAIRSQSSEQTATDFRKYLIGIGNRSFPFQLPADIEDKLHKLMQKIELNTGSIDLILTKDGRFVFLEVNPVGQFGMTSIPCNYYLEKKVAQLLTKMDAAYHGKQ